MKIKITLLAGALLAVYGSSVHAGNYTVQVPNHVYNGQQGYLKTTPALAQQINFDAATRSYRAGGNVRIAGKLIDIPAGKFPLIAGAGTLAKFAMRSNPYLLVGSLALNYLDNNGAIFDDINGWGKAEPDILSSPSSGGWRFTKVNGSAVTEGHASADAACIAGFAANEIQTATNYYHSFSNPYCRKIYDGVNLTNYGISQNTATPISCVAPAILVDGVCKTAGAIAPMTDLTWNDLPDPIPFVGQELPYAPWATYGAPVEKPTYDFVPYSVPTGEPYKMPDGSTVQPQATISPNGNTVNIITSTVTTINNLGDIVTNEAPKVEPEPQSKFCEDNPQSISCQEMGSDTFEMPRTTETLTFTAEPDQITGFCPAPIPMPMGHFLSFQPACDAMAIIRPIVIALASLLAMFIMLGGLV